MMGVEACNIFNADDTNVSYSMEARHTYAAQGAQTVKDKGVSSADRCSVMLINYRRTSYIKDRTLKQDVLEENGKKVMITQTMLW